MLSGDLLEAVDSHVNEGALREEEGDGEEQEEVLTAEMEEALRLNMQLKAMMAQAEEEERRQRAMRQAAAPRGPPRGGVRTPGGHHAAPGHAKNGGWGGATHTQMREGEINRDNQILVQKLTNIAIKPTMNTRTNQPFRQQPNKTSVAINRRRQDDKIARENAALARRLNSVKATNNLSRKATEQHAERHRRNLATIAGPPKPHFMQHSRMMLPPAAPGQRAPSAGRRPPSGPGTTTMFLGGGGPPDFIF